MFVQTVFLTGASGFLGSHIAAQLLDAGYTVRAAFRTDAKANAFRSAFSGKPIQTCIIPDITISGAYNGKLDGVKFVVHCASPYTFSVDDIQCGLIDPAVKGTTEILKAAITSGSVKRLVITSSFAAVVDASKFARKGYVYTEQDWNPISEAKALENKIFGYQASKTFAERAAWDMVEGNGGISLVTICPPMIFGPAHPASGISLSNLNESSAQLVAAAKGPNPMDTRLPMFVDVRDVAAIHVASLDEERVPSSERFLVCAGKFTWAAIRGFYQGGNITTKALQAADEFYSISTKKVEEMLGIQWISLPCSVEDSLHCLGVTEDGEGKH